MSSRALRGAAVGGRPEQTESEEPGPAGRREPGHRRGEVEADPVWTLGSLRTLGDRLR